MNARSLFNKMDDQRLQVAMNNIVKDSCFLLITVTWLNSFIPDSYRARRLHSTVT